MNSKELQEEYMRLKAESPCKGVCWIEPNGICSGCYRSAKEIREFGARSMFLQKEIIRSKG
jgi:predicted Fe-S protein YdhL (DUF1289 family)